MTFGGKADQSRRRREAFRLSGVLGIAIKQIATLLSLSAIPSAPSILAISLKDMEAA
jgi:hypothetical protein